MAAVSRQQVNTALAVFSIVRGTIDEIKPSDDPDVSDAYDDVVFKKTMEALSAKSKEG